jgi:hypothetical protein
MSNQLLPENAAQVAENCSLKSGRLEPLKTLGASVAASSAATKSIYLWRYDGGAEWMSWTTDVDVVKGPVADDQYSRIYFNEAGKLKVRGRSGGASVTRTVGIPTPNKPTATTSVKWTPDGVAGSTNASLKVRVSYSASAAGVATQNEYVDVTGLYTGYSYTADGKLKMTFSCPGGKLAACTVAGPIASWSANIAGQLTVGTGPAVPTAIGGQLTGQTVTIKDTDGTTVLATGTVTAMSQSGWSLDWNKFDYTKMITDFVMWPYTTLAPTFKPFTVTVTIDLAWAQTETTNAVYCITYVDDWGQEGPPSAASDQLEIKPGQKVSLVLPTRPSGYNLAKTRIYRSAVTSSTEETKYYYVGEATTTPFSDTKRDLDLGEVMPETTNPPGFDDPNLAAADDPNDTIGCYGLVSLPYGSLAAFYKKEIYFSEPYLPYSWPTKYRLTIDTDIVGLAVSGNDLVVLTKGHPYLISGYTPSNLSQTRLMINQSCVSKQGICNVGNVIVYPSPDGLVMISGGQARLGTDKYFTREDWQATTPTTMKAASQDGSVYAFTDAGAWVFDFDEGVAAVTTLTESAYALFADIEDDLLYLATSSGVCGLGAGTSYRVMRWRSKMFAQDRVAVWRVLRIRGETMGGGAVAIKVFGENPVTPVYTGSMATFGETPLPASLAFASRLEIEIQTSQAIDELLMLDEAVTTVTGPVSIRPADMKFSWRDIRFFFPKIGCFSVGRIRSEKYPVTLRLYRDDTLSHTFTVVDDADFVFPVLAANDRWRIDVVTDGQVYEVMLLPREAIPVDGAIRLSDRSNRPLSWRNALYQFKRAGVFVVGRVRCETYPCTLTLTRQGADPTVITVANDSDFYVPTMATTDFITVDLLGAGYVDEFLLMERQVFPVAGGLIRINDTNRPLTWKAMVAQFSSVSSFSVARVRTEVYPVILKITPDGEDTTSVTITNDVDVVLPALTAADRWGLSLEATGYVDELLLIEKKVHQLNGSLRLTPAEVQYSWKAMYFQVARVGTFNVGRVRSESYPVTMTIYRDGTLALTKVITDDQDFKVLGDAGAPLVSADEWRIDLSTDADPAAIKELVLTSREAMEVSGPVRLTEKSRPVSWKSMLFYFPRTGCFSVGRIRAETYPVTLKIYRDAALVQTVTVTNDTDFRLQTQTQNDYWTIDVESTGWIHELVLLPKAVTSMTGNTIRHTKESRPVTWRGMYYQFPRVNTFTVGRVRADSYATPLTLRLYNDGTLVYTKSITSDAEFVILGDDGQYLASNGQWEVDLDAGTTNVEDVLLLGRDPIPLGQNGIRLNDQNRPYSWKGLLFQFPRVGSFAAGRIRAESYPVTLKVRRLGDTTWTSITVANDSDFRFPDTLTASSDQWEVDVETDGYVDELILSVRDPITVNEVVRLTDANRPLTWNGLLFHFPRAGMVTVGRVRAETYPLNMKIRKVGDVSWTTVAVADDGDF